MTVLQWCVCVCVSATVVKRAATRLNVFMTVLRWCVCVSYGSETSCYSSECLYDCFAMVCVCVSYGSETSSYSSECRDDEEIALAIHAAEVTARHEARSRFKNAADLIHRLFVCISGHCDLISFTLCYICYL